MSLQNIQVSIKGHERITVCCSCRNRHVGKMCGGRSDKNKCRGEFVINKLTDKTCGEGFNEMTYNIIDKGDGDCLHSDLYKEKVPLKPCEFNEKCDKDLDCASSLCKNGF